MLAENYIQGPANRFKDYIIQLLALKSYDRLKPLHLVNTGSIRMILFYHKINLTIKRTKKSLDGVVDCYIVVSLFAL